MYMGRYVTFEAPVTQGGLHCPTLLDSVSGLAIGSLTSIYISYIGTLLDQTFLQLISLSQHPIVSYGKTSRLLVLISAYDLSHTVSTLHLDFRPFSSSRPTASSPFRNHHNYSHIHLHAGISFIASCIIMKGDPEFIILKYSAWLDASKFEESILGAVVRYPLKPSNDYVSALHHNKDEIIEGSLTGFLLNHASGESHDASAALGSVAGISWKGNIEESHRLAGKLVRYKRLQQHGKFWPRLLEDHEIKDTVPSWISYFNTWPPCLVVGVMMAEDVELHSSNDTERHYHSKLDLPVAEAALAVGGVPNVLGRGADAGKAALKLDLGRQSAIELTANSARSSIFALELRVVTTKLLRQRELAIKDYGPKVTPGRLAGVEDISDEGGDDKPPAAEDLIIDTFTDQEYSEMTD